MTRPSTRLAAALASIAMLGACTADAPSAAPVTAPPAPPAATLDVAAKGRVPTLSPFGLAASFVIKPADWTPPDTWSMEPDADWYRFAVDVDAAGSGWAIAGHPLGLAASIAPGRYRIGGVADIISDLRGPGESAWPLLGTAAKCLADLVVEPATTHVDIVVTFRDGACTIKATTR